MAKCKRLPQMSNHLVIETYDLDEVDKAFQELMFVS